MSATRFYDEITDAADAASQFGVEGFEAALRYQEYKQMPQTLFQKGNLQKKKVQEE